MLGLRWEYGCPNLASCSPRLLGSNDTNGLMHCINRYLVFYNYSFPEVHIFSFDTVNSDVIPRYFWSYGFSMLESG